MDSDGDFGHAHNFRRWQSWTSWQHCMSHWKSDLSSLLIVWMSWIWPPSCMRSGVTDLARKLRLDTWQCLRCRIQSSVCCPTPWPWSIAHSQLLLQPYVLSWCMREFTRCRIPEQARKWRKKEWLDGRIDEGWVVEWNKVWMDGLQIIVNRIRISLLLWILRRIFG